MLEIILLWEHYTQYISSYRKSCFSICNNIHLLFLFVHFHHTYYGLWFHAFASCPLRMFNGGKRPLGNSQSLWDWLLGAKLIFVHYKNFLSSYLNRFDGIWPKSSSPRAVGLVYFAHFGSHPSQLKQFHGHNFTFRWSYP